MSAPPEAMTSAALFEALFVRGLEPTPQMVIEMKAAGFDRDHIEAKTPIRIFNACMDIAHRHLYPGKSFDQADRELGKRFVDGFLGTLLGKVIGASLPLLGPKMFVTRFPRYAKADSTPVDVTTTVLNANEARVEFRGDNAIRRSFVAGMLEAGLHRAHAKDPQVRLEVKGPGAFDLHVRWT